MDKGRFSDAGCVKLTSKPDMKLTSTDKRP
jgi:hypothetical protein